VTDLERVDSCLDLPRLSQSLEASEAEALSLSQELSSMHAQVDSLSERVRAKLQEQRKKLLAAYDEIDSLRGESGRKQ
jgi:predicted  nucleic acid-binding Zn-ribbon protein